MRLPHRAHSFVLAENKFNKTVFLHVGFTNSQCMNEKHDLAFPLINDKKPMLACFHRLPS